MQRVLELYDQRPAEGQAVCVDEFGPLNPMPRKGKRRRPAGSPARLRATYNRYYGVMHMIAALDLATGQLYYRIRKRKRWREFLSFLKTRRSALTSAGATPAPSPRPTPRPAHPSGVGPVIQPRPHEDR
ncbi:MULTISPECIES: hypothetical protein [Streptosporangium]|uniref:Tc1-like transposase DDE domain-containing protein n=1 Tax=Streptosporangium brasiliense TaxID=47480 RepID=A0ABT9RIW2_9ACTN|nr:hypothetical protein [Streptosporangium brasiliense]MDP9869018.1 hypothetical protein [Streptosporangium brasiliense]